jgi:hypothetical protein
MITILVGAEKEKTSMEGDSDLPKVNTTVQSTLKGISAAKEWLSQRRHGRLRRCQRLSNYQRPITARLQQK